MFKMVPKDPLKQLVRPLKDIKAPVSSLQVTFTNCLRFTRQCHHAAGKAARRVSDSLQGVVSNRLPRKPQTQSKTATLQKRRWSGDVEDGFADSWTSPATT
jgi:hypothetical protein